MAEPAPVENEEEESDEGAKGPLACLSSGLFFSPVGASENVDLAENLPQRSSMFLRSSPVAGVQEHLKDAVAGTLKLKRLLSEGEDFLKKVGSSIKRRRTVERCGPAEQAKAAGLSWKHLSYGGVLGGLS